MLLGTLAVIQLAVFAVFYTLERIIPATQRKEPHQFNYWWLALGAFALIWLRVLMLAWDLPLPSLGITIPVDSVIAEGFLFYTVYSFGNYWAHRWKHTNYTLWHYTHTFHHMPSHMDTRVAFFRHPSEILFNSVYLIVLGQMIFGISLEAAAIALVIEGCLESFHHANIRLPRWMRPLGYVIQTPEMHLVHHELGRHKSNYTPFLWDSIFGTVSFPHTDTIMTGFNNSDKIRPFFLFRNHK